MTHRWTACTVAAALCAVAAGPAGATDRWTEQLTEANGGWSTAQHPREVVDVNGDGLADLVGFGNQGVYVAISSGIGFNRITRWTSQFSASSGWTTDRYHRTMGDVNGDGRADIVGFGSSATYVALSNGSGFGAAYVASGGFHYNSGWRMTAHERWMGDVNGDGRDDIVGFTDTRVLVALSNGTGFGGAAVWSGPAPMPGGFNRARHTRRLADINGDGRADVVSFHDGGVSVMLSTGSSFGPADWVLGDMGYQQRGSLARSPRAVGDVDGDGRADLVTMVDDGVLVARSLGGEFEAPRIMLDAFGRGWGEPYPRVMADIDGNGQADVVGFDADAVRVALAEDDHFDTHFAPLTGGDFVTRFDRFGRDVCLSTSGAYVVQQLCDSDHPLGWVLRARGGATFDLMQDGKCVRTDGDFSTRAEAAACGTARAEWFVERSRQGLARLRNTDGRCLSTFYGQDGVGAHMRMVDCDARDALLWTATTLRPQTMVTTLRSSDGRCLTASAASGPALREACDGRAAQQFSLVDNGHGGLRMRSHLDDVCLKPGSSLGAPTLVSAPCSTMAADKTFALARLEEGGLLLVSQVDGRCVRGSGWYPETALVRCDDEATQQWVLPEMHAQSAMDISVQGVAGSDDRQLVIGAGDGAVVTRDPVAIVAITQQLGLLDSQEVFEALLSVQQRGRFADDGYSWNRAVGPVVVSAELVSVSADYDIGLDGAEMGVGGTLISRKIEIGGVVHNEVRLLSAEARLRVSADGFEFGPSANLYTASGGFGDPDGTYAGISGGFGSRGLSAATSWGSDGRYGATVPLGVVAVDLYVAQDDILSAAAFATDVGEWITSAAVDAFGSAWSWSVGAFETATDAIADFAGDVVGFFVSSGKAIGKVFCGIFSC